jgi:hypothetical protein
LSRKWPGFWRNEWSSLWSSKNGSMDVQPSPRLPQIIEKYLIQDQLLLWISIGYLFLRGTKRNEYPES